MAPLENKDYIVVVQCHLVKQRCSGYGCERAFHDRSGRFAVYRKDKAYRTLYMTCGGCCGQALHRKLGDLVRLAAKKEGIEKEQIAVQLSTCIIKHNYHGPPCPHLDYLKSLVKTLGLDVCEGTPINKLSQQRREKGVYVADG